jgi:hypothetical protein
MRSNTRRGQSTVEYALTYLALILPLTMMLYHGSNLLWVWQSGSDFTRQGAQYAATHCWQPGGENVLIYMRQHTPIMFDRDQFRDGQAEIEVSYFGRNADSGALEEYTCDGSSCSRECVPDLVRVQITNYQYRGLFSYFGLAPVSIPPFTTSMLMESAGCSPDEEACTE